MAVSDPLIAQPILSVANWARRLAKGKQPASSLNRGDAGLRSQAIAATF